MVSHVPTKRPAPTKKPVAKKPASGNKAGVASAPAAIPVVTNQPGNAVVQMGYSTTLRAQATGTPRPTVQWFAKSQSVPKWEVVLGATGNSLVVTPMETTDYRAVFSTPAGSVSSLVATIQVMGYSNSWSGEVTTGGALGQGPTQNFTGASATWVVPSVTCTASNTYSLQWVGVDGWTNNVVEQDGTEADCIGGSPFYTAWYEMWGNPALNHGYQVDFGQNLSAGDVVNASTALSNGVWIFVVQDVTAGWTATSSAQEVGTSQGASAEFVVERPLECWPKCVASTLSDLGSVSFSNLSVVVNGVAQAPATDSLLGVDMLADTGLVTATTGAVADNAFTATYVGPTSASDGSPSG